MSEQHTAEPWYPEGATIFKDIGDHRYEIAICGDWSEEAFANAQRICACVNACRGMPTEWLEQGKSVADAFRWSGADVLRQRDELLAELQDVLDWAKVERAPLRKQEIESIERLIAKVGAGGTATYPDGMTAEDDEAFNRQWDAK